MNIKCACNSCHKLIEFEVEQSDEVVLCPYCGQDTRLFIPQNEPEAPPVVATRYAGIPTPTKNPAAAGSIILLLIGLALIANGCMTTSNGILQQTYCTGFVLIGMAMLVAK